MNSVSLHEPSFELPFVDCPVSPVKNTSAFFSSESEVSFVAAAIGVVFSPSALRLVVDKISLVNQSIVFVGIHSLPIGIVIRNTSDVVRSVRIDEAPSGSVCDSIGELPFEVASVVKVDLSIPVHRLINPLPHIDSLLL